MSYLASPVLSHPAHPVLSVAPCPVLSCTVASCPVQSCRTLSCPVAPCSVLSHSVLSCRTLSCPVAPCPVLSHSVLSCRTSSCPVAPLLSCPVKLESSLCPKIIFSDPLLTYTHQRSKHETLYCQCCLVSTTVVQHLNKIGAMPRVCWELRPNMVSNPLPGH